MGKSHNRNPQGSKPAKDTRDPAEIRSELFRVAAQRETVEAFVVAFILALLFRAFLAEAFVIPTGSMAPTLMGAAQRPGLRRMWGPVPGGSESRAVGQ